MPAYPARELSVTYSTSSRSFTGELGTLSSMFSVRNYWFVETVLSFGMAGNKDFWEEVSKLPKLRISHFWRKG